MKWRLYLEGFSFMSDNNKLKAMDMQYIEGGELERAWKSSRRERQKAQEKKIWDEFVKEQDVVESLCNDDPYQFLDSLPEENIKEMLENEIQKMRAVAREENELRQDHGDDNLEKDHENVVINDSNTNQSNEQIIYIYEDQTIGQDEKSKEEQANKSANESPAMSQCTVRESMPHDRYALPMTCDIEDLQKHARKDKSNHAASTIENSIYCVKVTDLRWKINEVLLAINASLENRLFIDVDPEVIPKMKRRSSEFSARFTRIHLYQLKKQLNDIERNNSIALPFAKHTQFQSQMVRVVSLHQNMLNSLQVFNKALEHTPCLREGIVILNSMSQLIRDVSTTCLTITCPQGSEALKNLYNDDVVSSAQMLDETVTEYSVKIEEFSSANENVEHETSSRKRLSGKIREKKLGSISSSRSKPSFDNRLSMYSMGSYRFGSDKRPFQFNLKKQKKLDDPEPPKSARKSHRPLMRDPHEGQPKAGRTKVKEAEGEIKTMVEAFGPCISSHNSFCDSYHQKTPLSSSRSKRPATPRGLLKTIQTPNNSKNPTPRKKENIEKKNCTKEKTFVQNKVNILKEREHILKNKESAQRNPDYFKSTNVTITRDKMINKENETSKKMLNYNDSIMKVTSPKNENAAEAETEPPHKILVQCVPKEYKACIDKEAIRREFGRKNSRSSQEFKMTPRCESKHRGKDVKVSPQADSGEWAVTQLLQKICGGDASGCRNDRIHGAKNAQLHYISSSTPRNQPPSTSELLRLLEETIEKKPVIQHQEKRMNVKDVEKLRMTFNIPENVSSSMLRYRTRFLQHMLTSPMYANSVIGKPWETIGRITDQIINELLVKCAQEIQLEDVVNEMYKNELL